MARLLIVALMLLTVLLTRVSFAQSQAPEFQYIDACLREGKLEDVSFEGAIFYQDAHDLSLRRSEDDWQPRVILLKTEFSSILSPYFEPDGYQRNILAIDDRRNRRLMFMNAEGKILQSLTWEGEVIPWFEGWTQDHRMIINRDTNDGVDLVGLEGDVTAYKDLPEAIVDRFSRGYFDPAFYLSPNVRQIVYRAKYANLVLVDLESKTEIWRTNSNEIVQHGWSEVYWAPNGQQFAYVHREREFHKNPDAEIALVNADGEERIVTDINIPGKTYILPFSPLYWSPDGAKIAFYTLDHTYIVHGQQSRKGYYLNRILHILNLKTNTLYNLCLQQRDVLRGKLIWSPTSDALIYLTGEDNIRYVDFERFLFMDTPLNSPNPRIVWLVN